MPVRFSAPLRARALPVLALVAVSTTVLGLRLALGAAPAQAPATLYLPDLQADENGGAMGYRPAARPLDQEGFGSTEVEIQNVAQTSNNVELVFEPKSGSARATLKRTLGARQATRLQTRAEGALEAGFFSGTLLGSQALGAIARVRWVSGANSAYEAAPAARDMILPLIARTVYSHTSYVYVQNAAPGPDPNKVDMTLWNNETGAIVTQVQVTLDPGETASWDTAFDQVVFGPEVLGSNAPTGGWLGHAWFSGEGPIATMAYGDELDGRGSSAFIGRPVAAADTVQFLPLVRANVKGDTLIAVANAGNNAVDVTIDYIGAPVSPSGSRQTFSQSFQISPRGSRFVDLSTRGRGTVPSPGLPRGAALDQGFLGSAIVRASGPVLAVAQDEQLKAGRVDSVAAYNAFGPRDLGTAYSAPVVRRTDGYLSSTLYLYNPGDSVQAANIQLRSLDEQARGDMDVNLPPGSLVRVNLSDREASGVYRAEMTGTGPFAALIYDERDLSGDPGGVEHSIRIRSMTEDGIAGTADLTEKGNDLEVVIQLRGAGARPGTVFEAAIRQGQCARAFEVRHPLNDVRDGRSTTVIAGLSLADLTATPHALVLKRPNGAFPGQDVACGFVEEIHTGEETDSMLAWPVRLSGGSLVTPGTPSATPSPGPGTETPSPGPPTETASPTAGTPEPGSPTPDTATPGPGSPTIAPATGTPPGEGNGRKLFLPHTLR